MRYLSFGLDPSLTDPSSAVFARQVAYFSGAEATVIAFHAGKSVTIRKDGLTIHRTGGRSKLAALYRGYRFALKSPSPDVVIAQDAGPLGALAWFVAHHFEAKLFLQDHSGVFSRSAFGWKERLFRPISRFIFCAADQVRVVSERAKSGLIRIGVQVNQISVQPIRTDVSSFAQIIRKPSEKPVIICIARLEREKGLDVLIRSCSLVQEPINLCLIGDGSQRRLLEQQVKSLKLDHRVQFVGKKTQQEIQQLLSTAWMYVQPSHFEGWGMAVVEAAAAGLPIVMTDVGCAGELFKQEESALIVHPGDAVGFARAIDRVMSDAELATRMGQRAREIAMSLPGPEDGVTEMRKWLGIER